MVSGFIEKSSGERDRRQGSDMPPICNSQPSTTFTLGPEREKLYVALQHALLRSPLAGGRMHRGEKAFDAVQEHGGLSLAITRLFFSRFSAELVMALRQDLAHFFQDRLVLLDDGLEGLFAHC